MSDPEARLAAELDEFARHWQQGCDTQAECFAAIAPTIARHMALGAAVDAADDKYFVIRRLPYLGTNYPPVWQVWRDDKDGIDHPVHTAPTLTDAIDAALRDPEEAEHE